MLLTVLSFVFVLGVLIFIHELGHFLVAKRVGIRVDKFSLGFPPNIFAKKWGETEYCIGIIPLGGFVKMAGENPDEEPTGASDEFMSKTVGQRAAVIFAGPFMNYVLAIIVMIAIFMFAGIPQFDESKLVIGETTEEYPAAEAGMEEGDVITSIDGKPIVSIADAQEILAPKVEEPVNVTWYDGNDTVSAELITRGDPRPNLEGGLDTVGVLGFKQKIIGYERMSPIDAVGAGFVRTHEFVYATVLFLKQLVTGQVSAKMIGGPIFIAQQSGRTARSGPIALFTFMALLSVNLAVLNILPIPVLDGGHLVFLAIEKVRGTPLSMRARMIAQQIGVVFLLGLIVIVTYNDILRAIRGF